MTAGVRTKAVDMRRLRQDTPPPGEAQAHARARRPSPGTACGHGRGLPGAGPRGSVTAEFAVVLPAVTALLALLLLGAGAGILQLRLEEGARAGARSLARGESAAQAQDIARRVTGGVGTVTVDLDGGYATVTFTGRMSGPLAAMMPWQQTARASARLESNASASAPGGTGRPGAAGPGPGRKKVAAPPAAGAGQGMPPRKSALWRWVHVPLAPEGRSVMVQLGQGVGGRVAGQAWCPGGPGHV